jgi:hypothetical protein
VFLQLAPLQDERQLVVDVAIADVTDLYGAEIQLTYNPAQLQVQDANARLEGVQIAPGPFLVAEDRFVVTNKVDPQSGVITFVVTLLNPAPPVSGSGVLATVAFDIIGSGPYSVDVTRAQLVSSKMVSIPVVAENLVLPTAGQPASPTTPPSLVRGFPTWGWWPIGIACLLLAMLGVLWVRERGRASATPAISRGAPAGVNHTSAETSAMLTEQGRRAMQRGDLAMAHELFSRAVERDPANAAAWLGKGLVAQQTAEKRICFQRVLALDPGNSVAQVELQQTAGS